MSKNLIVLGALSAFALTGCGVIEKQMVSTETLQEKAAQRIEVAPENITISNVKSSIDKVTFLASTERHTYNCYYTTAVAVTSDAVCNIAAGNTFTPAETSKKESTSCNALLKAAGRCE